MALARRSFGMRVVRVRGNAHDVVMSPRARFWWLIGSGVAVLGLGCIAVIVHDLAPTRWPKLAIRWSPSVDHVMRAAFGSRAIRLNWPDPVAVALTARFPAEALERNALRGGGYAERSAIFLVARASDIPGPALDALVHAGEPAARAALRRLLDARDPQVRRSIIHALFAEAEHASLIEHALMDDDPLVVDTALLKYGMVHPGSSLSASPVAISRFEALLDASARPVRISDVREPARVPLGGDLPIRWQSPEEADRTAESVRLRAWEALARHAPQRARAAADTHPFPPEAAQVVAAALRRAPKGVPWLAELLGHPDERVVSAADGSLVMCAFCRSTGDDGDAAAAWLVLASHDRMERALSVDRRGNYYRSVWVLRRCDPSLRASLLAVVPEPHRDAIAAALSPRAPSAPEEAGQ